MFGWKRRGAEDPATGAVGPDRSLPTRVLSKFVAALSHVEAPAVLDLGPVVGPNVSFFGERLGCKIFVEDFYAEIERARREAGGQPLDERLPARLTQPDASIDGILCWDLFDFLDKPAAQAVGRHLVRMLRPRGVLMGFFAARPSADPVFTRFVVADEHTLIHRPYRGVPPRPGAWPNRDIALLFPGLQVIESYLLKTQTREILFRKPVPSPQVG